jgi:hypothetical protein
LEPLYIRVRKNHFIGIRFPEVFFIYSSSAKKDISGGTLKMIPLKTGD